MEGLDTFFCSAVPLHGSGGSDRLLGPVVCCSSFAAATSKADSWPALMPHLLRSQLGCLLKLAMRGTTAVALDESQPMLKQLLSECHGCACDHFQQFKIVSIAG